MKNKTNEPGVLRAHYEEALKEGLVHNQKEFAKLTGISETSLSQFLNGTSPISDKTIKHVKDAICAEKTRIKGNGNATATGPNSSAQVISGDLSVLISEMAEQRKVFVEQLKVKDEQIAKSMQLLQNFMSTKN